jgi:hypothetical protein
MHVFFTLRMLLKASGLPTQNIYMVVSRQDQEKQKLVLGEASNAKFSTFQYYHSSD